MALHRLGTGDGKKRPQRPEETIEPKQVERKHKPVMDLYSYHGMNVRKFDALAECNPDVEHICVGHELDARYNHRDDYQGKDWDPDEIPGGFAQGEPKDFARRTFSSRGVLEFLNDLGDGSINRINIDCSFPGREVIAECMRVLEPGGAIEFGTLEDFCEESERAFRQMRLDFGEVELTPLDFRSDFLKRHQGVSEHQPRDRPIKYVVEKPGGGPEVDRRTFYERLRPEAQ